jgi:hypothetical protein
MADTLIQVARNQEILELERILKQNKSLDIWAIVSEEEETSKNPFLTLVLHISCSYFDPKMCESIL